MDEREIQCGLTVATVRLVNDLEATAYALTELNANDFLALLWAATRGEMAGVTLATRPEHAMCVVIAARGYPDAYGKGEVIDFPAILPAGVSILHAGTARNAAGQTVTNGGRVLGVTALAPTLRRAADLAYGVCDQIGCASKYFRRDIGARQLNRR
jgi:phosphoribosylamine--glycine ligase